METEKRTEELLRYQENYKKIVTRLEMLLKAFQDYDKKTINKAFFEKYFTLKYTKEMLENDSYLSKNHKIGDIRRDWKGDILTDFHFTNKNFDWEKYYKRIYLADSTYLEVQDNTRETAIKNTIEKLSIVMNWVHTNKDELENLKQTDEKQLIKDLIAVYKKHNCPKIWDKVLSVYEVKYPNK